MYDPDIHQLLSTIAELEAEVTCLMIRAEKAEAANTRLRGALEVIERRLTNLQPHILPAAGEKASFIDDYVDPALEAARAALDRLAAAG
jgi:thioester reductase-like protein